MHVVSRVVHVQAGVRGGPLEDVLAGHGLTVGHYPQPIAVPTVGGWIAASSAGQASTGFGAIEDVLLGLTAVLPQGRSCAAGRCHVRRPGRSRREVNHPLLDNAAQQMIAQRPTSAQVLWADS